MKKIFFTGANGFIGSHLVPYLKSHLSNIYIHEYSGKIESYSEIENEFKRENWDYIFHFAGMSHVSDCELSPQKAFEVNVLGTLFLAQLISNYNFSGRLFFASTSLIFDFNENNINGEITERSKIKPLNTYSRTKFYAEKIVENLSLISSAKVCILRLFNHTHKSQSSKFILPSVCQQVQNAKEGDTIKVGNLDLERDFSLVTDFVKKISELLLLDESNNFQILNLSSGVGRNLRTLVELIVKKSGKKLNIEIQPNLIRTNDPKRVVGKFKTSYNSQLTDEEFIEAFLS